MTKTRRSVSLVAAAALLLGLVAPAMAQSGDDPPAPAPDKAAKGTKAARPDKVKKIEFKDGETIDGEVPSGQIIPIDARGFADRESLIKYRYSFVDRVYQSAENI